MNTKGRSRGFPGGAVVENLPANAGGVGSVPGWGAKIPHASRQKTKTTNQQAVLGSPHQSVPEICPYKQYV